MRTPEKKKKNFFLPLDILEKVEDHVSLSVLASVHAFAIGSTVNSSETVRPNKSCFGFPGPT